MHLAMTYRTFGVSRPRPFFHRSYYSGPSDTMLLKTFGWQGVCPNGAKNGGSLGFVIFRPTKNRQADCRLDSSQKGLRRAELSACVHGQIVLDLRPAVHHDVPMMAFVPPAAPARRPPAIALPLRTSGMLRADRRMDRWRKIVTAVTRSRGDCFP